MRRWEEVALAAGAVALAVGLLALLVLAVVALWQVWAAGLRWQAVVLLAAVGAEYTHRIRAERRTR